MKKHYVKPMMVGEAFSPGEYCSVCFGISCDYGESGGTKGTLDVKNPIEMWGYGTYHTKKGTAPTGTGCGHTHNQFIQDHENGTYTMIEVNTERDGTLPCTLYTDSNWNNKVSSWSNLTNGQTVYWSTEIQWGSGKTPMYHKGQVVFTGSVNHS